jgi:Flp pilus assembly pilin Flp
VSDLTIHTAARIQVAAHTARQAVAGYAVRAADRFRREQTGQDVLEYAGMIVLVALVIFLIFQLQLPQAVQKAVTSAANSIFSAGSSSYSAPTVK